MAVSDRSEGKPPNAKLRWSSCRIHHFNAFDNINDQDSAELGLQKRKMKSEERSGAKRKNKFAGMRSDATMKCIP
jgi:hypothetical protein